jgi:hypothetical protein
MDNLRMALKSSQIGGFNKMKYVSILLALAVLCLIAAPAIGVADAKGYQLVAQDGTESQLGNGQNGAQDGTSDRDQDRDQDRDGSCIVKVNSQNGAQTGDQDGTPDRIRDGSCQA